MFKKSKKTLPVIQLYSDTELIYDGLLRDVPLKEAVILKKSEDFFDDPEPCHIHRSAVRTRLTAEILEELTGNTTPGSNTLISCMPGPLFSSYVDFPSVARVVLKA